VVTAAVADPARPAIAARILTTGGAKGPCQGDLKAIVYNAQGLASCTDTATEVIERRLLKRAGVAAVLETGWNQKKLDAMAKKLQRKSHRIYAAVTTAKP